ncbi:MAG TPA: DNA N-6-adenine-methyltransferase [Crinalium sp.]
MKTIEDLQAEMAGLQAEVARISSEGRVLMDCWIAKAKPGSKKNKYPRLKSRKPIFNGKKTEYLSIQGAAVTDAQAAIERGKTVKQLKKRIRALSERLDKLTHKASSKPQATAQKPLQKLYPPFEVLALARQVMGAIDLDPVSDEAAQQWVQAATYYTPEQEGLTQPWFGRVWLYLPLANKAGKWIKKAVAAFESGKITAAILLVKPALGSKWFQKLMRQFPVCFPSERLRFLDAQGTPQPQPQQSSAFLYLGQHLERFKQVFGGIGGISIPA